MNENSHLFTHGFFFNETTNIFELKVINRRMVLWIVKMANCRYVCCLKLRSLIELPIQLYALDLLHHQFSGTLQPDPSHANGHFRKLCQLFWCLHAASNHHQLELKCDKLKFGCFNGNWKFNWYALTTNTSAGRFMPVESIDIKTYVVVSIIFRVDVIQSHFNTFIYTIFVDTLWMNYYFFFLKNKTQYNLEWKQTMYKMVWGWIWVLKWTFKQIEHMKILTSIPSILIWNLSAINRSIGSTERKPI